LLRGLGPFFDIAAKPMLRLMLVPSKDEALKKDSRRCAKMCHGRYKASVVMSGASRFEKTGLHRCEQRQFYN
jgi:hypothetical protein